MALVSDAPETTDIPSDTDCDDEVEEIVAAPSLSDMRQQLKGFATFVAENPQFPAAYEMLLQKVTRWLKCLLLDQSQASAKHYILLLSSIAIGLNVETASTGLSDHLQVIYSTRLKQVDCTCFEQK